MLRDFYKCWYRPDLQAVVIVGDFDVNEMEAKLKESNGGYSCRSESENCKGGDSDSRITWFLL